MPQALYQKVLIYSLPNMLSFANIILLCWHTVQVFYGVYYTSITYISQEAMHSNYSCTVHLQVEQ